MQEELEVTYTLQTKEGNTETHKYTTHMNAGYSDRRRRNFIRSDIYLKHMEDIQALVSLDIRGEAEIYQNT